jgi:hypothetical protein
VYRTTGSLSVLFRPWTASDIGCWPVMAVCSPLAMHRIGSMGGGHINRPAIQMATTQDGKGYWFVSTDGGVFTFGDALFFGSLGNTRLNAPVLGMAATGSGRGYWLAAADGGVFTFGDARFFGAALGANKSGFVGVAARVDGRGYWLVAGDGTVYFKGDGGPGVGQNTTFPAPSSRLGGLLQVIVGE